MGKWREERIEKMRESTIFQKLLPVILVLFLVAALTGCGKKSDEKKAGDTAAETVTETVSEADTEDAGTEDAEAAEDRTAEEQTEAAVETDEDPVTVRVGSLKGPTTMGLVNLMLNAEEGSAEGLYDFRMETQPDVIVSAFAGGELDIALIPANLASVLYNKTSGNAEVICINTLGVLYCVTGDDSIHSVKDLSGKTVLSTGQGATPEYALNYLLKENGVTDCNVEFKSEATEIAALLQEDPDQVAILPQPFVTVAEMQNDQLTTAFSLTDEWDALGNDSQFLTGVTVVRKEFLEQHRAAVEIFLRDAEKSASRAVNDVPGTAELVVKYGIIEKDAIASKALPECGICHITGEEMKKALGGYLQVLFEQDAKAVGGSLPADDFYYMSE